MRTLISGYLQSHMGNPTKLISSILCFSKFSVSLFDTVYNMFCQSQTTSSTWHTFLHLQQVSHCKKILVGNIFKIKYNVSMSCMYYHHTVETCRKKLRMCILRWIVIFAVGNHYTLKVYIRGNVTCNTMTNRETLYNMCELDTRRGAHGDHDSIRLPPADGKKLLTTRCGFWSQTLFLNLYSFSR